MIIDFDNKGLSRPIVGIEVGGFRCTSFNRSENTSAGLIIITENNAGDRIIITDIFGVE